MPIALLLLAGVAALILTQKPDTPAQPAVDEALGDAFADWEYLVFTEGRAANDPEVLELERRITELQAMREQ
jgi:hypothetical protein